MTNQKKRRAVNWPVIIATAVVALILGCLIHRSNGSETQQPTPARPTIDDRETTWTKYLSIKTGWRDDVIVWDESQPDLVSHCWAIEVDWASKWAEGIGQAFDYAASTNKRPAVLLLVKDRRSEEANIYRAERACRRAGVLLMLYDCKSYRWLSPIGPDGYTPLIEVPVLSASACSCSPTTCPKRPTP